MVIFECYETNFPYKLYYLSCLQWRVHQGQFDLGFTTGWRTSGAVRFSYLGLKIGGTSSVVGWWVIRCMWCHCKTCIEAKQKWRCVRRVLQEKLGWFYPDGYLDSVFHVRVFLIFASPCCVQTYWITISFGGWDLLGFERDRSDARSNS